MLAAQGMNYCTTGSPCNPGRPDLLPFAFIKQLSSLVRGEGWQNTYVKIVPINQNPTGPQLQSHFEVPLGHLIIFMYSKRCYDLLLVLSFQKKLWPHDNLLSRGKYWVITSKIFLLKVFFLIFVVQMVLSLPQNVAV